MSRPIEQRVEEIRSSAVIGICAGAISGFICGVLAAVAYWVVVS